MTRMARMTRRMLTTSDNEDDKGFLAADKSGVLL